MSQHLVIKQKSVVPFFTAKKIGIMILSFFIFFISQSVNAQTGFVSPTSNNTLKITDVKVIDESVSGLIDGKIVVTIDDKNLSKSTYRIVYDFLAEGNTLTSGDLISVDNKITFSNAKIGPYFNLKVLRVNDNKKSAAFANFKLKNSSIAGAESLQGNTSSATCSSTINYTNCAGSSRSISNAESNKAYNDENDWRPCGFELTTSCTIANKDRWHCIDGNLSTPPNMNKFSITDYTGVGLSALQACRINWIVCNYSYNASNVSNAVWYITGSGGSNNSIALAAVAAVPVVNGTQGLMKFYKSNNSSYQDMVKWECVSVQCNARVTSLYFNELNNGPDLPITNGSVFSVSQLGSLYNLEAGTSGTVGSVKFTITGPTASNNTENTIPYNSPSTGSGAWTGTPGNYSVNIKAYSSSNAGGSICHDTTITFTVTTTDCNCTGTNLVLNPGFESGTTNWSWSGGTLAAGNGAVACGSFSGDLNNTSTSSKAWQLIGTDLPIGTVITTSVYAGTHDNSFNNWVAVEFLNASNVVLGTSVYVQVDKVIANSPAGPQLYNFSATVPTGTKYTRVAFGGTGSFTKTDRWCVTKTTPVTGSIGDRVWLDANGNGIQDATETGGITGVTVQLRNSANTVIATQTTNGSGNYLFTGLAAGTYTVVFPVSLSGSVLTTANVGSNDDIDSDPSQTTGITPSISLAAGQNIVNVDAGYSSTASTLTLGNKVFFDRNRSGMYDAGDSVAAGIIVRLYNDANNDNVPDGAFIQATTTNGAGDYAFTNLTAGNYIVGAVVPAGHAITVINGGDPDNNIDNDNNAVSLVSGEARGMSITLSAGAEPTGGGNTNDTYDIGLFNPTLPPNGGQSCFIGVNPQVYAKSFWNVNVNSQTVTVRVTFSKSFTDNCYKPSGNADNWNRSHTFGNLTGSDHLQWSLKNGNGTEVLKFKQDYISSNGSGYNYPSGYGTLGFSGDGGNPSPGATTDVLSFRTSMSTNFNEFGYALTTDSPPTDTNYTANPAAPNWIYEAWYEVTLKASVFGTSGFGFVDVASVHSSPSKTGNNTETITNTPCVSSIGDRVWYDTNRDGIQNAGENGIRGVTVKLRNAANVVIATQVTNASGNYLFSNLNPGMYTVEFPVTVYGYKLSPAYVGTNRNIDSDPSVTTGLSQVINLGTAENDYTIDAGYAPDCDCVDGPNNLLTNPSFENGTTGWSWSSANGSLTTGTGFVACGTKNGFNNQSSGTSRVWQDVNMAPGSTVTFSAYAATHTAGLSCSPKLSLIFLNAANAVIGQTDVTVTRDVDINNNQLEQYSITAIAPTGTVKVRVQSSITCNTMKLDAFCLTAAPPILGSIGDRVWVDSNKDGVQDASEVGLAGVVVTLYDGTTNNVLASTITDAYGNYKFSNLETSATGINYQIRFSQVPGYAFSPNTGAVSVTNNSDANPATGRTATITLTNAMPNVTYADAGMYYTVPARIGDYVWNDLNKNGIQEAGEPGIAGVPVMLYTSANVLYRSTVTSNNGYYFFNDLAAGTYYIKVAPPIGYQVSPKDAAADDIDSDIDPVTRNTPNFTVVAGTNNLTLDAGFNVTSTTGASASLGDKVWEDLNNNNIQDAGEPGIANVTVQLFNGSTNALMAAVVTDAFGNYIFNGLMPGSYFVKFTLPTGFTFVTANVGTNDDIDSDADAGSGNTPTLTLVADEVNLSVDGGMRRTTAGAALGDYVWYDLNKNGTQDGGAEVGAPGITVVLYNSANAVVATTTTNINGFYLFTGLTPATTYTVGFENIPAGYGFSPNVGAVSVTTNSDVNPSTGRTSTVTTGAAGSIITYVDAGLITTPNTFDSKASVGDKVWNDLNNNGIQDPGEPGIPGVTVTLYAADGTTVVATTTTDALGNYLFTNLSSGSYVVGFSGLPTGYVFSPKDAGSDDSKDSDADAGTGKTAPFTLAAGEINLTIDAGARNTTLLSSLGNYVWYDTNNNGIQDATEKGAAGVSVALKNASGTIIKTTTTSATGEYLFTDLAAGTYFVQFGNLPVGYAATTKNAVGSTTANNSDANTSTLSTDAIVLAANTTDLTWDMGIVTTTRASVGDFVWNDTNGNGIQDAGEKGVAGVTVTLYDNNNNPVASTVTDANGFYLFSNVLPGSYSVGFSNIPASSSFTTQNAPGSTGANNSDVDPATGRTASFTLTGGQSKTDVDAGLVSLKAAVGDYVWHDLNRNGIQDAGEVGVPGVTVTMYKSTDATIGNGDDVAVASAVTDANGYYFINDVPVPAGGFTQYYMRYTDVLSIYSTFTSPLVGGTSAANNSKVTAMPLSGGRSGFFTLNPGQVYRDMDAGVYKSINLSGNVWHDTNGMTDNLVNNSGGAQVPPAISIPTGLRVSLVDAVTGNVVRVTLVQGNGVYNFNDVLPGNYILVLGTIPGVPGQPSPFATLPSGWMNTGENLGLQPGRDPVINGKLSVSLTTTSVINANFGMQLNNDDIGIN